MLPAIQAELPTGVELSVTERPLAVDPRTPSRTSSSRSAWPVVLVIIAIYFFLRSFRATLIPAIALPISVIGTFAGMYAAAAIRSTTSRCWR